MFMDYDSSLIYSIVLMIIKSISKVIDKECAIKKI